MADEPASKTKKKRLVKNPETFRERAIKAAEGNDKPSRVSRVKTRGGKMTNPVVRPMAQVAKFLFNVAPIRLIRRILRRPLRILGRILLPKYVRSSWQELRLVQWPNWQTSRALTGAVLVFAISFGAMIALVDYGLDKLFRDILLK